MRLRDPRLRTLRGISLSNPRATCGIPGGNRCLTGPGYLGSRSWIATRRPIFSGLYVPPFSLTYEGVPALLTLGHDAGQDA